MMNRMLWYVIRSLSVAILVVWAGLLAFDAVFAFLGEVADIGRGDYRLPEAIAYTLLTLPHRAYALFPMACLVGVMFGLGNLAVKSELIAMRASGVSIMRLLYWCALTGFTLMIAVFWLGEGLAPMTEKHAGHLRTQAIFNRVALQDERGVWIRDKQRYVHIGNTTESSYLQDVQVLEFDADHQLLYASSIKHARYDGVDWRLLDVLQTQFDEEQVSVVSIAEAKWSLLVDPELIDVLAKDPDDMTLPELYRYIDYLNVNEIGSLRYRMHFWSRIVQPLTAVVMLVLGAAFVLVTRQRSSSGWRLFVGLMAGFAFKLLSELFLQTGLVYGLPVIVSAFGPTLLVVGMTVWLVRYARI